MLLHVRVAVLGPLVVEGDMALGPRDRIVLTALASRPGELLSGERLADALWGEAPPASWNKVVQGCIVRLRKALGADAIETRPNGYRLTIPPDEVDAGRFERFLGRAREWLALDQPDRALYEAEQALALWRGRALAELDEWESGRIEANRLDELRMDAEELRLDAALRSGRHREVLASARACVEAAPTRERRWELLALAQYRSGSQGDALRTLHQARATLARELGLGPGPELLALERAILEQHADLAGPVAPSEPSGTCPWPGLLAYGVDDDEQFFGRDAETVACLERLRANGVLVVVGPSGSGKSSLVRAGVAAGLRHHGRRVAVVTPGSRPTDALTVLAGAEHAVLVVDQCEEAVTLCADPSERSQFFDALVRHAEKDPLVISLRADRVGEMSAHAELARLMERGMFLLGPMAEAELRASIEGPAARAGLLLEPGLVDLVVREVLDEPGALPLMSHALRQTWARRQGRTLTVAAYRESGGIREAVAQSAEAVYGEIDEHTRSKLRELLLRLVAPVDNGDPARVRMPRQTLAGDAEYERLIDRLVTARLLTSDGDTVELAHEALAGAWPRLRDWLLEDVDGARLLRHLAATAAGWGALDRPESELYRGVRLAQALEWRERAHPELTSLEHDFLDASAALDEQNLRAAQAQVVRERRTVHRLRRMVAGVALLAIIAAAASVVAVGQRRRADDEARVAEARRVSAEALVADPYDRALLLGVEAVRLWNSPETRGNLITTIDRSPRVAGVIRSAAGARMVRLDVSPTSQRAVVTDVFGDVTLYDLSTRAELAKLQGGETVYDSPVFSPDGTEIAVTSMSSQCLYDPECGEYGVEILTADGLQPTGVEYTGLRWPAVSVTYSPTGGLLAAVPSFVYEEPIDNVVVWKVGQPDQPYRRLSMGSPGVDLRATPDIPSPGYAHFSPDGTRLYVGGAGTTTAFDVETNTRLARFDGLGVLAVSPDGESVAVLAADSKVELRDSSTGDVRAELLGHGGLITAASFSRDGSRLATSSKDETVVIWDVASGVREMTLDGHTGTVSDVAFSADGMTVYSTAADRSLLMWDVAGTTGLSRTLVRGTLAPASEGAVIVSPTGDTVLSGSDVIRIIDIADRRVIDLQPLEPYEVIWFAYHPDGRSLVTVGWDGTTKLWRVADGTMLASRPGRGSDNFGAVAFSGDGRSVLVADFDGTVTELEATTLEPTGRTVDVGVPAEGIRATVDGVFAVTASQPDAADGADVVFGDLDLAQVTRRVHVASWAPRAVFSADGSHYAVGGYDGRLGVIDVATGEIVGASDALHSGPVASVTFSQDGSTLASLGFDGVLILSDPATGEPRARIEPGRVNDRAGVGFHPDGHTAILGYHDGTVLSYETGGSDPEQTVWVEHACRVVGRNLTVDEWRDAFGDEPHRRTCPLSPKG